MPDNAGGDLVVGKWGVGGVPSWDKPSELWEERSRAFSAAF